MNKTIFLSLVRQASNISDQDVEELEKLVVNFPYCQTAHLLIAKAAYDNGSMLSNQKLKKAAIYAANRQLLKKLIYTSDASVALNPVQTPPEIQPEFIAKVPETSIPEIPATEVIAEKPEVKEAAPEKENITPIEPVSELEALSEADISELVALISDTNLAEEVEIAAEIAEQTEPEIPEPIAENEAETSPSGLEPEISEPISEPLAGIALPEIYEDEVIAGEILETETEELAEPEIVAEDQFPTENNNPEIPEEVSVLNENPAAETFAVNESETNSPESDFEAEAETEVLEETGNFIAEPAETLNDVDELHELFLADNPETAPEENIEEVSEINEVPEVNIEQDELHETLASFDKYLFKPEKETEKTEPESDLKVVYAQDEIQEIYDRDPLGYWMGSSRMGESLQLKNELTSSGPVEFHPELILEYSKTHELHKEIKPVNSNLSKQLEIIDEFLKMTPRLKAMANAKVKTEAQEDLSIKSSKISKNLATESLANIMVQQGKIKKAIKIYEHLILKIPEKKPYFVAQIQKLQNLE